MTLEKDENLVDFKGKTIVLAVSGGVDSMVLLDIYKSHKNLIVAHADHNMREDSGWTAKFVEAVCEANDLKFVGKKLNLDSKASEGQARELRYSFLNSVLESEEADLILTAHHRDDVIETMVFNILRGTGRRGLTSLKNRENIARPLLNFSKAKLYEYAKEHKLEWLEDESNRNDMYARNEIRLTTLPHLRKVHPDIDQKLFEIYTEQKDINSEIDQILGPITDLYIKEGKIERDDFRELDPLIRKEIVLHYLRTSNVEMKNIGRSDVVRIEDFILNAKPAKKFSPTKQVEFSSTKNEITVDTVVG